MTHKQLETLREIRLWTGQILVPAASVTMALVSMPEVRGKITTKYRKVKQDISTKFKKKERKELKELS